MKTDRVVGIIAAALCFIAAVVGVVYHEGRELDAMKSNIESAIVKGIDPVAVKCAYGRADPVCVVYAATKKTP